MGGLVAWLDPDSMDPGDPAGMTMILGAMGILTGILFGWFFLSGAFGKTNQSSLMKVVVYGILATAIVQVPFLGHGDSGLLANMLMALLFSGIGGVVSAAWWTLGRVGLLKRIHLHSAK